MTDHCRELLAAYVDGELSPRQRKAVLRLLEQSGEARVLLRQMQHDAAALRQLPRQRLERDLAGPVLQTIAERKLQPGRRRQRIAERRQTNFPVWVGFTAVAASLLLVVLGSYFYFAASMNPEPDDNGVAHHSNPTLPAKSDEKRNPLAAAPKKPSPDLPAPKQEKPQPAPAPEVVQGPKEPPAGVPQDNAKPTEAPVLGAPDPVADMEMFKVARITQMRIVKLNELEQDTVRQLVLKDLRKEPGYRMESPCKDSVKAFDRLQAALKAHGIGLAIDQVAQARMNARRAGAKVKTNFVVYLEDVTPEELVKALHQAGLDDRKAEAKKKGDGQFEAVVINAMTDADREELCKLLGVKAKKLPDPAAPTGPLGVDLRKPLSDKTGDDIAKSLTGQGGVPRPEPGKLAMKPAERLALAMPYNPVRPRPESPEIKRFLASRKAPRPGAVQVLLVLREMDG